MNRALVLIVCLIGQLLSISGDAQTNWVDITSSLCHGSDLISKDVRTTIDYGEDLAGGTLSQGTAYVYKVVAVGPNFTDESNEAESIPRRVVMLVRGYGPANQHYWDEMRGFLEADGFEVWDPNYFGWTDGTRTIEWNSGQLLNFVKMMQASDRSASDPIPSRMAILAHSMGGVIARDYMSNAVPIPVDRVVMLSPANCGSWLANQAYNAPWASIGWYAWDSTYQLRIESMLLYNIRHHDLPRTGAGTRYSVVAANEWGTMHGGLTGHIIDAFERTAYPKDIVVDPNAIANDGVITVDGSFGVVSKASAQLFSILDEESVRRSCGVVGFDAMVQVEANHLSIIKDRAIYQNYVRPMLLAANTNLSSVCPFAKTTTRTELGGTTPSNAIYACAFLDGFLSTGLRTNLVVTIDTSSEAQFLLSYSTGIVGFVLHSPSGTPLDPSSTNLYPDLSYIASTGTTVYVVRNPQPGVWTTQVDAVDAGTGCVSFSSSVYVDNDLGLIVTHDTSFYPTNAAIIVLAKLVDGTSSVASAAVSGTATTPLGTSVPLVFSDDGFHGDGISGDGIYGVVITNTADEGRYQLSVAATGVKKGGEPFRRIDSGSQFTVFKQTAVLTRSYEDYGLDDVPTNGLIDRFVVEIGILANATGSFSVAGTLVGTNGLEITSANAAISVTNLGAQMVPLTFESAPIYDSRETGGFDLRNVYLFEVKTNAPVPLDSVSNAYETGGYDWEQFQPFDSDSDGLSDLEEQTVYHTDAGLVDSDADGLSDYSEVMINDTNPLDPDTDGDGLPDGWELTHDFDPLIGDSAGDADGDGLGNIDEYLHSANPQVADSDGDGLSDGAEVHVYGTNPSLADTDDDGLNDYAEVFYDGISAYSPLDPTNNPTGTDADANNSDTDGDGMPDGWEIVHGLNPLVNDADRDPDKDGVTNLQECRYELDPQASDSDGDGIPDGWELRNLLNARSSLDAGLDYDGDGLNNMQEFLADTEPTNSLSTLAFTSVQLQPNGLRLAWIGGVLSTQTIEKAYAFAPTNSQWLPILTNSPPTPLSSSATITNSDGRPAFFRIDVSR